MARYDVYIRPDVAGYVLDCQSDLLSGLTTRLVVPLLHEAELQRPISRLNPRFRVRGQIVVMATQFAAAIATRDLGECAGSLSDHQDEIMAALDMLISGF